MAQLMLGSQRAKPLKLIEEGFEFHDINAVFSFNNSKLFKKFFRFLSFTLDDTHFDLSYDLLFCDHGPNHGPMFFFSRFKYG